MCLACPNDKVKLAFNAMHYSKTCQKWHMYTRIRQYTSLYTSPHYGAGSKIKSARLSAGAFCNLLA